MQGKDRGSPSYVPVLSLFFFFISKKDEYIQEESRQNGDSERV